MILMVSGRCDIPAYYSEWFNNRLNSGFLDVRNPFNPKLVSRIYFKDVDLFMFCTKNPHPIIKYLNKIDKPIVFHVTLTPYKNDIELNVSKDNIINDIKEISKIVGIDNFYLRYDPILLNDKYHINYHLKAFKRICELLDGYVKNIIVSFVDIYKNVINNMKYLNLKEFRDDDYKTIGINFSNYAKMHNMTVQTCFEKKNLVEYGFVKGDCISQKKALELTSKAFKLSKIRDGKLCKCAETVDIGSYNSCFNKCRYCYANFNEELIEENMKNHDPNSSLLIGHINSDDIIKVRK